MLTSACLARLTFVDDDGKIIIIEAMLMMLNGRHFPHIFKRILLNESVWISVNILLKFVSTGPINKTPSLDEIMPWRRAIIWTNHGNFADAYMRHSASMI